MEVPAGITVGFPPPFPLYGIVRPPAGATASGLIYANITAPHATADDPRAYIDLDPGFTQIWAHVTDMGIDRHNFFFTVGQNVERPEFRIPTRDVVWHPIVPPVASWANLWAASRRSSS